MAGDASGPLKVLGDIRDVLVSILSAVQQEGKHEEGQARTSDDARESATFHANLADSLKDAITTGLRTFTGRGGDSTPQPVPTVSAVPRPQPGLSAVPQSESVSPARMPEPVRTPTPSSPSVDRPAPKPLDLGTPFKDRPERKNPSDAASVPAVVPTVGSAPTANLIPTTVPAEMRTGVNLPQMVPTTNQRPMGTPATTAAGSNQAGTLPTTPALTSGGQVGGRQGAAGGARIEGGGELLDASRRLGQSAQQLSEAARNTSGDVVELSDNWSDQGLRNLINGKMNDLEVPSLYGQMPGASDVARSIAASRPKDDKYTLTSLITRLFGS